MIECKGRNGYFKYGETHIWTAGRMVGYEPETYVEIRSKRSGKSSPIVVKGKTDEVLAVFEEIVARLKEEKARNL